MAICLKLHSDTYTDAHGKTYTGYGLTAWRNETEPLFSWENISPNKTEILDLIGLLENETVGAERFAHMLDELHFGV
ncbi:MAG: hypothetical protein ACI4I5_00620 [Acutalibacteraceae bacterium]